LNTAHFENEILHLQEIMIPPLMSSTMSSEDILGSKEKTNSGKTQNKTKASNETKESGRPSLPDD
jgi:hypothetical protein